MPELVEGFKAEHIWNVDETRCFWRAFPDKGLGQTKTECKGGKKSKQKGEHHFHYQSAGESEYLHIVICHFKDP